MLFLYGISRYITMRLMYIILYLVNIGSSETSLITYSKTWRIFHLNQVRSWCRQDGRTPIHCASEEGYLDIVELLLAHGAEIDTNDSVSLYTCSMYIVLYTYAMRLEWSMNLYMQWDPKPSFLTTSLLRTDTKTLLSYAVMLYLMLHIKRNAKLKTRDELHNLIYWVTKHNLTAVST